MSAFAKPVQLGPQERVAGHTFADPWQSDRDLTVLRFMRRRLCQVLRRPASIPAQPRPFVLNFLEDHVRQHRIVISQLELLLTAQSLIWVGFCGQRRAGADWSVLDGVDVEMIDEFPQHPGLYSYSSLQLDNGDWRNLVLLGYPEAIAHWGTSARHRYAAEHLAPLCYQNIRLHRGVIRGNILSDADLTIVSTKYYDYQETGTWMAVRKVENGEWKMEGEER